jgi:hypothetical protein
MRMERVEIIRVYLHFLINRYLRNMLSDIRFFAVLSLCLIQVSTSAQNLTRALEFGPLSEVGYARDAKEIYVETYTGLPSETDSIVLNGIHFNFTINPNSTEKIHLSFNEHSAISKAVFKGLHNNYQLNFSYEGQFPYHLPSRIDYLTLEGDPMSKYLVINWSQENQIELLAHSPQKETKERYLLDEHGRVSALNIEDYFEKHFTYPFGGTTFYNATGYSVENHDTLYFSDRYANNTIVRQLNLENEGQTEVLHTSTECYVLDSLGRISEITLTEKSPGKEEIQIQKTYFEYDDHHNWIRSLTIVDEGCYLHERSIHY